MKADLLIKNGRVIDPANGVDQVCDVAIANEKILAVGEYSDIEAGQVIDAEGCIVVPGIVDSHQHLFEGSGYGGVSADVVMLPYGCTTGIDAGSAGVLNFPMFSRHIIAEQKVTVKAMLNVSAAGLATARYYPENVDPAHMHPEAIAQCVEKYRDQIVALKLRISNNIVKELCLEPLKAAVKIGEQVGLPLQIHSTNPSHDTDAILDILRPGDMFSHAYHGIGPGILDENGCVRSSVKAARKRGVLFDVANGGEHFSWRVAKAAMEEGFYPDIISTDQCRSCMFRTESVQSIAYIMSKYLCAGMDTAEVIEAVTWAPAKAFGLKDGIGMLRPGTAADVAVFRVEHGKKLRFSDKEGHTEFGDMAFVPKLTIKNGTVWYRQVDF